jgi:hypothetical protein
MTPEQIEGRLRAIEVIVSQLVITQLMHKPDKEQMIENSKEELLGTIGNLSGATRTSCVETSTQIFDKAYESAVRFEAELKTRKQIMLTPTDLKRAVNTVTGDNPV